MKPIQRPHRLALGLGTLLCLGLVEACGGSGGGGGGTSQFFIAEVSNGFGRLLPYQIAVRDSNGNPTSEVIEITSIEDLVDNVTPANSVRTPTEWPEATILPSNVAGNHFVYVRFTQEIDIDSVLLSGPNQVPNNLAGAVQVVRVTPSGATEAINGRAFVGGRTYTNTGVLQTWVVDNGGILEATDLGGGFSPGRGFPGTQGGFAGDTVLVQDDTLVFVVDTDGDLSGHEMFPTGFQIQVIINEDVFSVMGRNNREVGLASSTVGEDTISPKVKVLLPGDGELDVDPETNIEVIFTEPVQVLTIAELDDGTSPGLSSAITLEFGPQANRVQVPYFLRPFSVYDLSRVELVPAYNFPGSGPEIGGLTCGTFGDVTVTVIPSQYTDLSSRVNADSMNLTFSTMEGAGIVNAPVVPDAIYLGRGGANPGLSVVDLYGFGGGTGNPTYDQLNPIQPGASNFPNNPNVSVLGASLLPPLTPGTCTIDGGSEGVFTLTKDSSLNDLLARAPILLSVGDITLGHALDNSFNNAAPFGCQAGGGNICASTGLKFIQLAIGGAGGLAPATNGALGTQLVSGGENLVSFAPSPNPPPLIYPPLCLSPLINAQEPTAAANPFSNLLVPGANNRGNPLLNRPPTNLLAAVQNSFFDGPSPPQPAVTLCATYVTRQQIGQFLYVIDRVAAEVVVLNSNRFTVIDRIRTPDPTSFAMSPNLDLLAVTNESADQVSFIDTKPSSVTFHQIVRTERVGVGPTGIAWEPGNEDLFVCNQGDGSVTVLSAFSLRARKTIRNQITRPIDVALTPRQLGFGYRRGVYFGYILNQDGSVAIFESGPNGTNGIGFDDTISTLPFTFFQPKAIQPDMQRLDSAVWVLHENPLDINGDPSGASGGAITVVGITSGLRGVIPFITGNVVNPQIRNLGFGVLASIGEGPNGLTGVPVDLAFDNMVNVSALPNYSTSFSAGQPINVNGRASVRFFGGGFVPTSRPQYMFLAVPNPGVVDVLELSTGTLRRVDTDVFTPGVQSITAPNVSVLADFFRQ